MTEGERDAVQGLISAMVRVARAPMTGVNLHSPMARAIFNLTIQLAAAGIIKTDEAQAMGREMPDETFEAEVPK